MDGSELSSFVLKFSVIYPGIFLDRRVQTGGWLGRDQNWFPAAARPRRPRRTGGGPAAEVRLLLA